MMARPRRLTGPVGQVGQDGPRQRRHQIHPVRMRPCRGHDQKPAGGEVLQPDGAPVAQEGHRRGGSQDDPLDLQAADAQTGLARSTHRLRGHECEEKRATLDHKQLKLIGKWPAPKATPAAHRA